MPLTIEALSGSEILDSRGEPTLSITLKTTNGTYQSSAPAGASTGAHEAHELRDQDIQRFNGRGVRKAAQAVVDTIAPALVGISFDQASLDAKLRELDGTPDVSRLGANTLLPISLAFAKAISAAQGVQPYRYISSLLGIEPRMPVPFFNVINGGRHADSGLALQEFMLVPKQQESISHTLSQTAACITRLRDLLSEQGYATSLGDEGGFAPHLTRDEDALALLAKSASGEFDIAIDAAATQFWSEAGYTIAGVRKTPEETLAWYGRLASLFPVVSLEDPFAEDEWDSFTQAKSFFGHKVRIVGDDLTTTNAQRIRTAAEHNALDVVLIKPNQIGTLSDTLQAIRTTRECGMEIMVSHRSGETNDDIIADIAVGAAAPYCKFGSLRRGERIAKYNRLVTIEKTL